MYYSIVHFQSWRECLLGRSDSNGSTSVKASLGADAFPGRKFSCGGAGGDGEDGILATEPRCIQMCTRRRGEKKRYTGRRGVNRDRCMCIRIRINRYSYRYRYRQTYTHTHTHTHSDTSIRIQTIDNVQKLL